MENKGTIIKDTNNWVIKEEYQDAVLKYICPYCNRVMILSRFYQLSDDYLTTYHRFCGSCGKRVMY